MSTTTSGVEGAELEAGRVLDALVAERVFGQGAETRCYSTDMAAAWEVIAALRGRGFLVEVGDRIDGGWYAQAISADDRDRWECETCRGFSLGPYSHADTAPLAICRAALAATSRTTNPEASTGEA